MIVLLKFGRPGVGPESKVSHGLPLDTNLQFDILLPHLTSMNFVTLAHPHGVARACSGPNLRVVLSAQARPVKITRFFFFDKKITRLRGALSILEMKSAEIEVLIFIFLK